ncbi:MAG: hypothetical protein JWM57_1788 [Phycisphaerales bacterium]|nr:hypothetical protein [Phycisphaerales bacterium]
MRALEYLSDMTHDGMSTQKFEEQAEKIPTNVFWAGAMVSIGLSLGLKMMGRHRDAEFVGHWAPTFIGLGLLRKLIEHDKHPASRG